MKITTVRNVQKFENEIRLRTEYKVEYKNNV